MLVGEIGISPDAFCRLKWWEVRSIIRGYNRRYRNMWSATRWQTYNIMASFCGGDNLSKNGLHSPKDLLPFPWEQTRTVVTPDDVKQLQAEMAAINAVNL